MIIESLCDYYDTLSENPKNKIPKYGYKVEKISYVLDLDLNGYLKAIHEMDKKDGEKLIFNTGSRSGSGYMPYILHDKSKYILGVEYNKAEKKTFKYPDFLDSFIDKNKEIFSGVKNEKLESVFKFLEKVKAENITGLPSEESSIYKSGIMVFRVDGEFVHEIEEVKEAFEKSLKNIEFSDLKTCMISGEKSEIALTHNKIKGISGGQASGTSLVSFNGTAYCSYGKSQNYNSPISKVVADKYVAALNYLIKSKENKRTIGSTTIVFWATGRNEPNLFDVVFGGPYVADKDKKEINDSELEKRTRALIERFHKGMPVDSIDTGESTVSILGLSPNNARVAVQFFYKNSYEYFVGNISKYHRETSLNKKENYKKHIYFYDALRAIATNEDSKNIHDSLKASLFYAIANGTSYPKAIYIKSIERIKAELSKDKSYRFATQVALVKAYLIRNTKFSEEELKMSLNEDLNSKPYTLGRIFAVLESVQYKANGSSNIRERYFQAASTNPKTVFGSMFSLYTHHLQKLNEGHKINVEKQIQNLINRIDDLPSALTLEEQGVFILGYYHQRQSNFDEANKNTNKNTGGKADVE